jgi:hypothetical protein
MAHHRRRKLFVDSEVQGKLVLRVVVYWLACLATLEFARLTWQIASGPTQPGFSAYFVGYDWLTAGGRVLLASVLLLPIVWDVLNFSNRFAGPVFRMRRVLRQVAQGGKAEQIRLRSGDYWSGMADDLNAALARLETAPASTSAKAGVAASQPANDDDGDSPWLADDFASVR